MFAFGSEKIITKKELTAAVREALDEEMKARGILLAQRRRAGRPRRNQKVAETATP